MESLLGRAGLAAVTSAALAVGAAAVPATPAPPIPGPGVHAVGPPPAHTGGFGEPTCQICHEGDPLNAYGGSVRVEGLPEVYEAGRTYPLRVILEAEQTSRTGFQLAARFRDGPGGGTAAGVLSPVDPGTTVTVGENGIPYLHQTEAGAMPLSSDGSTWVVEWRAPTSGGAVVLNVAANSANGDNSPLLDLVYTTEATTEAATRR